MLSTVRKLLSRPNDITEYVSCHFDPSGWNINETGTCLYSQTNVRTIRIYTEAPTLLNIVSSGIVNHLHQRYSTKPP